MFKKDKNFYIQEQFIKLYCSKNNIKNYSYDNSIIYLRSLELSSKYYFVLKNYRYASYKKIDKIILEILEV